MRGELFPQALATPALKTEGDLCKRARRDCDAALVRAGEIPVLLFVDSTI
jgi:hypothetical protein